MFYAGISLHNVGARIAMAVKRVLLKGVTKVGAGGVGVEPECVIWISNILQDADRSLYSLYPRVGQKINIPNKTICRVDFYLKKYGSPTGTLYARIRKVSDDSIIETSPTTLDVATLTTTFAWYSFAFNSLVNEEVRICVEFTEGSSGNRVLVGLWSADVISGVRSYYYLATWYDSIYYDLTIKIYELV